jgi:hypothetical protein
LFLPSNYIDALTEYRNQFQAGFILSLFEIPLEIASDVTISRYIKEYDFSVETLSCYEILRAKNL